MNQLIATAIRAALGKESGSLAIVASGEDLSLLDREGVAGLVAEVVDPECGLGRSLKRRRLEIFAQSARVLEVLDQLSEALRTGRCGQVVVLKGAALLTTIYRARLGGRPLSDLDLLIRKKDFAQLSELLQEQGFRRFATRFRGDGVEIDLHTHLGRSALLGRRYSAYTFSDSPRTTALFSQGAALRKLAPDVELCHLAVHAVKHAFCRWIWLADILLLLPAVDQSALLETAREVRAGRALGYCRYLSTEHLGVSGWPADLPFPKKLERRWLDLCAERALDPIGLGRVIAGLAIPQLSSRLLYWSEVVIGGRARGATDLAAKVKMATTLIASRSTDRAR